MEFTYDRTLYPQDVLIRAAWHFTDRAYVHLDCDATHYRVTITMKETTDPAVSAQEFDNVILAQLARYSVEQQTHNLRELAMARALASSVVETSPAASADNKESIPAEDILKDWFEKNEQ